MLVGLSGTNHTWDKDCTYDIDDDEANRLLAAGYCEKAKPAKEAKAKAAKASSSTETATVK